MLICVDSGDAIITDDNRASSEEIMMEADMEYDPEDQLIHSRYGQFLRP